MEKEYKIYICIANFNLKKKIKITTRQKLPGISIIQAVKGDHKKEKCF